MQLDVSNKFNRIVPSWFIGFIVVAAPFMFTFAWRADRALLRIELGQTQMIQEVVQLRADVDNHALRINAIEKFNNTLGGPNDPLYSEVKTIRDEVGNVRNDLGSLTRTFYETMAK